jgi:TolB-like protein
MTGLARSIGALTLAAGVGLVALAAPRQNPPPQAPSPPQQPTDVTATVSGGPGAQTRLAVPDFLALSADAETAAIAKVIAQVLYDDLAFEREFALIPRDTYSTIPAATSFEDVPFDRWRELNADGVVMGTVQKMGAGIHVEVRLFNVRTRVQAFGKGYDGSAANPRLYAHTVSDDLHLSQRAGRGPDRWRSLRSRRRALGHTIEAQRQGDLHRRLRRRGPEASHHGPFVEYPAELVAGWLGRAASFRRGLPNIFVSHIYQGTLDEFLRLRPEGKFPADVTRTGPGGVLSTRRRQP